jgi:hypothetical protein
VVFGEDKEPLVSEYEDKSAVEALADLNMMDNAMTAVAASITISVVIFGSLLLINSIYDICIQVTKDFDFLR